MECTFNSSNLAYMDTFLVKDFIISSSESLTKDIVKDATGFDTFPQPTYSSGAYPYTPNKLNEKVFSVDDSLFEEVGEILISTRLLPLRGLVSDRGGLNAYENHFRIQFPNRLMYHDGMGQKIKDFIRSRIDFANSMISKHITKYDFENFKRVQGHFVTSASEFSHWISTICTRIGKVELDTNPRSHQIEDRFSMIFRSYKNGMEVKVFFDFEGRKIYFHKSVGVCSRSAFSGAFEYCFSLDDHNETFESMKPFLEKMIKRSSNLNKTAISKLEEFYETKIYHANGKDAKEHL